LFMFHGFMAHGRELMFKFCVEKSWVWDWPNQEKNFLCASPFWPIVVCGEWWTLELTICSRPPLPVSYLPPSQTGSASVQFLPQILAPLPLTLYMQPQNIIGMLHCNSSTLQIGTLHVKRFTR
jgi:hypothetical protein